MAKSKLVITGGGFAGTALARRLEKRLPEDWQVILLNQDNCITYNPLLAEVVGASMLPGHAVAPIRQIVIRGISGIDFPNQHETTQWQCATGP